MFHDYLTTCCDTKLNIAAFHLEGNGEERNRQCKWEQHAKKMFLLNMTQFSSFVTNCTILLDRFLIGQLGLSLGGLLKLSDDRDHQISICYFLSGLVRQLKRSDEFVLKTHSRTHTHTHGLKYFPSQQFNNSQALYRTQPLIHCRLLFIFSITLFPLL